MSTPQQYVPTKVLVLVALSDGELHGYALHEQIVADTVGAYVRRTSLYRALGDLERDGLIIGSDREERAGSRAFRISAEGRDQLRQIGPLYARLAGLMKQRLR